MKRKMNEDDGKKLVGVTITSGSGSVVVMKKITWRYETMSIEESKQAIIRNMESCADIVEVDIKYLNTLKDLFDFYVNADEKSKEALLALIAGIRIDRAIMVYEKEFVFAGIMAIPVA